MRSLLLQLYSALDSLGKKRLAMVFICGLFNIFITVTKVRKMIIKAIPVSMQHAMGAGLEFSSLISV